MKKETADLLRLARQARSEHRFDDARRGLLLATDQLRQTDSRLELAEVLRELGELERRPPRFEDPFDAEDARRHYEESVAVWRELDEPLRLAHTVRHLGDVHQESGRPDLATPCYHEALAIYRGNENTASLDLANAIRSLALLEQRAGRSEAAGSLWREAHDLYKACGVAAGIAESAAQMASPRSARSES